MITKNLGHQLNYRKVTEKWSGLKAEEGKELSSNERACLYLCSLVDCLANYLYENFDFDFVNDLDYYNENTYLILKITDYILNDSKDAILLREVIESKDGPFILQALNIAFPILRTGHANLRNGGRKSIYSDELINSMIKDREKGLSFNELAEKYNIPKTTVQYHCKSSKVAK